MHVSGYPQTNPMFKLDATSIDRQKDLTDHRSASSQSMSPIGQHSNHLTSPKIIQREIDSRNSNLNGRIGLKDVQGNLTMDLGRQTPAKIELNANLLKEIKSPKEHDYKSANEVLESLKKLISALQEKQLSLKANLNGLQLKNMTNNLISMGLENRNLFNARQRELQNGVYPYNTILSMTEQQIQTQIKIREALRAGQKNRDFGQNQINAYKSLHNLLSTNKSFSCPVHKILFELIEKLLSFENVEQTYKTNLQKLLDDLSLHNQRFSNQDLLINKRKTSLGQNSERQISNQEGRLNSLHLDDQDSMVDDRNGLPDHNKIRSDLQSSKSRGAALITKDSGPVGTANFNADGWISQRSQPSLPNQTHNRHDTSTEAMVFDKTKDKVAAPHTQGIASIRIQSQSMTPGFHSQMGHQLASEMIKTQELNETKQKQKSSNVSVPLHQIIDADNNLRSQNYLISKKAKEILCEPHN